MLGCLTWSPHFGTTPAKPQRRGVVCNIFLRPRTTETLSHCGPSHGKRGYLHPRPRIPRRAEPTMPHLPQGSD